jgi:1-deoxy-D-xylulose-5-phosphate reductoisomerase
MKRIAILGSTGSVGTNALRLIADRPDRFGVAALTAHQSVEKVVAQAQQFAPTAVCVADGNARPSGLADGTAFFTGSEGVVEALEASRPDVVLNAITGAAGLPASEWTVRKGLPLALANKESLVMAGPFLMELARESGSTILPVDSEHCAIFQCLVGEDRGKVRRIHLTASGGPFRTLPGERFADITPEEALRHPTWDMGPRITIGSATLMNKAFEVLEAHWLFGLSADQIHVICHPQSIVHSMVEFVDGSILAQLGVPDMRVPILYCLAYPERAPFDFMPFDASRFSELNFHEVDTDRFPAIPLAFETLEKGGTSGAVLNAADEVMTGLFLAGKVSFPAITQTVTTVVRDHAATPIHTLEDVLAADRSARDATRSLASNP